MSSQTDAAPGVTTLLDRSRQGDSEALAGLRQQCHTSLLRILLARGATQTEAEDLLADLWADCVPSDSDAPCLLDKFSGRCSLQGWLATVATNRWVDLKRRQERWAELPEASQLTGDTDILARGGSVAPGLKEDTLLVLLRDALQTAFARCSAEALVLLRLLYEHKLTQRELCRMLGWSESKLSRFLSRAMEQIQTDTLRGLGRRDPWLDLSWDDFRNVCEIYQIGFL